MDEKIFADKRFNETEAGEFLGKQKQTMSNWRHLRKGPPYYKLGRNIFYLGQDLMTYREKHRIEPEAV